VHPSVREKAAVEQDQGKVWAAVRSGTTTTNTRASTGSAGNARAVRVFGTQLLTVRVDLDD